MDLLDLTLGLNAEGDRYLHAELLHEKHTATGFPLPTRGRWSFLDDLAFQTGHRQRPALHLWG